MEGGEHRERLQLGDVRAALVPQEVLHEPRLRLALRAQRGAVLGVVEDGPQPPVEAPRLRQRVRAREVLLAAALQAPVAGGLAAPRLPAERGVRVQEDRHALVAPRGDAQRRHARHVPTVERGPGRKYTCHFGVKLKGGSFYLP